MIAAWPLALCVALAPSAAPADATEGAAQPAASQGRARGDLSLAPTLGLGVGQTLEAARVEFDDGGAATQARALTHSRLDLGLSYALLRRGMTRVRGQSSAGVGLVYAPGDWPVHLRQDFGVELVPKRWFGAFVGLGVGFDINTTRPVYSAFALALPLGLRFGPVELVYRPALSVGLGAEHSEVLGGSQRRSAATGVAPFELLLRVRIPVRGRD